MFAQSKAMRNLVAVVAAVLASTVAVGAAVGPAQAGSDQVVISLNA